MLSISFRYIVGFLTEWQTYVQQIEGENWKGEKMDKGKVDKMSGKSRRTRSSECSEVAMNFGRLTHSFTCR